MEIQDKDVLSLVMQASPSFRMSPSAVLMHLAGHVFEIYKSNRLDELSAIFDLIEHLHKHGNHDVREAATISFLESLQNIAANEKVDPEVFLPFLGEETRKWWDALNDFWSGKKGGVFLD